MTKSDMMKRLRQQRIEKGLKEVRLWLTDEQLRKVREVLRVEPGTTVD
jgi:hypothetical protein